MGVNNKFWRGKRVFLTGHTGFKGGWLSLWLSKLGAEVTGFSLPPNTTPNLYTVSGLEEHITKSVFGDIRDFNALVSAIDKASADIIFHLAAQPLVRYSYDEPVETFSTNVMGTVNLLQAVRDIGTVKALVNITSDKCYENREWIWPYRECDVLGGYDPYSSSKACAEMVTSAYQRSFMDPAGIHLATARAGNVIGGGDWAADRLIPDALRAWESGQQLMIRSPIAVRPWQHVLEPLFGYLMLAERLFSGDCTGAWNFGPSGHAMLSVSQILSLLSKDWGEGADWQEQLDVDKHESGLLMLDSSKAREQLGWASRWSVEKAVSSVVEWQRAFGGGANMYQCCMEQIAEYEAVVG